MSDTLVVEAPVVVPEAAPAVEAPKPLTSKEFMEGVERGNSPAKVDAPVVEAPSLEPAAPVTEQPRGPDGKFVAIASAEPEATATPAVPAGFVRIELPEGHPLRDRGRDHIFAPADQEADYRGFAGSFARRAEVEQRDTRIAELEATTRRLQAETEVRSKVFAGPEYAEVRAKIEAVRSVDADVAALMERGLDRAIAEQTDGRVKELDRESNAANLRDSGNAAESAALDRISTRFPQEWLRSPAAATAWQDAADTYIARIQRAMAAGQTPTFDPDEIVREFDKQAITDPWLRNHLSTRMLQDQEQRTAQIRADAEVKAKTDAAAAEKARLDEQLLKRKQNPMGRLFGGMNTGQTVPTERVLTSREFIQQTLR